MDDFFEPPKKEITSTQVKEFWRYMSYRYDTRVIEKRKSLLMKIVAWLFQLLRIMKSETFMLGYTTTVGYRIYVPFVPGRTAIGHSLRAQVATCVHEHVHTREVELSYLFNSRKRTRSECEAYRATMEVAYWFTGRCPDPARMAARLGAYRCTLDDIAFAEAYFTKAAEGIKRGDVITPESQVAFTWWNDRLK